MNFQKTFLAASLTLAAVAANAQWVNPAQNVSGLANSNGFVKAPVLGQEHLKPISTGHTNIDLGSGKVSGTNNSNGTTTRYEIFNYKTTSGKEVISVKEVGTGKDLGFFLRPQQNGAALVAYTGNDVDLSTLSKGGQLSTADGSSLTTGDELKVVNGEHVIYGYQGTTNVGGQTLQGDLITPDGTQSPFKGTLPGSTVNDTKYVQTGIIGNTGPKDIHGHATDASKNIYGVSAKDGNNITVLTGNGIALGNLANGGQLNHDGSVVTANGVLVGKPIASSTLKSREYQVGGTTYLETFNDDKGNEVASSYYRVQNGQLVGVAAAEAQAAIQGAAPNRSGTATSVTGNYQTALTKNTITNQNVTYSEQTTIAKSTKTNAGITNSNANGTTVLTNQSAPEIISSQKQSVSTGVIGKEGDDNVYGLTVQKETTENGKVTSTDKTTITAGGITTTGTIDAKDYKINGVSIVDNIKTSVDGAVAGATEEIDKKVAQVDEKIVEVDKRLTEFNTTASNLNSRVDQLNGRIDDVEETAYRGIAIALAAQQAIPNIGAGQTAVFGGVGHYEGESAGALGVATVFADGRTSVSGALGVAGGGEVGGRVGVAYVFGGK